MPSKKPDDAQKVLAEHYPVELPPDFFAVWELARSLMPEDPCLAFGEGFVLTGPYELLAGKRPRKKKAAVPLVMHWRFYLDPPEFFTVASGHTDGLHWGYWFDVPGERPPVVCSYYNNDAYELHPCGDSLVEALEEHLEREREGLEENIEDDPGEKESYEKELANVAERSRSVKKWRWPKTPSARRDPNIPTFGGMGLIVSKPQAKGLLPAEKLYQRADRGDGAKLLADARAALGAGKLGLALEIARAVWTFSGSKASHPEAALLLAEIYDALGRPALAAVARVQAKHRGIPSVDLLS